MKHLMIIIPIFALLSCKSNQVVQSETKHDSIYVERIVHKYEAVNDTIIIANPCDSSGILTTFYSKINAPQGSIVMKSDGNKIKTIVRYYLFVSEHNQRIEYRDRVIYKTIYKTEKTSNFGTWMWVILIAVGLGWAVLNFRPKFL
jgi:hypothetical protein